MLLRERYDDGGFSGGTMERPALQRLLEPIHKVVESYESDVIPSEAVIRLGGNDVEARTSRGRRPSRPTLSQ
jgi:DNA invertase Pin-like site-specific DNA recombinase